MILIVIVIQIVTIGDHCDNCNDNNNNDDFPRRGYDLDYDDYHENSNYYDNDDHKDKL